MFTRHSTNPIGRLIATFNCQQRKLFLLIFLWTCLCFFLFRSTFTLAGLASDLNESNTESVTPTSNNNNNNNQAFDTNSLDDDNYKLMNGIRKEEEEEKESTGRERRIKSDSLVSDNNNNNNLDEQLNTISVSKISNNNDNSNGDDDSGEEESIKSECCRYQYPRLYDLQFNNIHWQRLSFMNETNGNDNNHDQENMRRGSKSKNKNKPNSARVNYYLYNAYYDDRKGAPEPSVRILAMIDRIHPPPTNCLLWSKQVRRPIDDPSYEASSLDPIVTRAEFIYAWYPNWGNYNDGILQPWIITCPIPHSRRGIVPDSVSLVSASQSTTTTSTSTPTSSSTTTTTTRNNPSTARRNRRDLELAPSAASIAMPPASSSSAPISAQSGTRSNVANNNPSNVTNPNGNRIRTEETCVDCRSARDISNNLPVFNERPPIKKRFGVCVKGLDFPDEDISVRLVEWIELLNLLGASKIFLYVLNVHENISKVLHYYSERGIVELIPITLPGDQPNLPEFQHLYLKSKLTTKRQNELIPYNDCLYRNLYAFQYLALLDIDEIIMPLKHHSWFGLMDEVESRSLKEQNYTRASYNTRNVYFFDDLAGPLGTTTSSSPSSLSSSNSAGSSSGSHESGIPYYLHMMQHVYRSKNYTKPGQYVKCFHNVQRVLSLHNHFPLNCLGQCTTYSIPISLAHLQHYRKDCVGPLKKSCKSEFRHYTMRDVTIWRYKQQMIKRTTRVLSHLNLLDNSLITTNSPSQATSDFV